MKKHLFTLITSAACLFAGTAQAQNCCCTDSFYVGALGGVNFVQDIKVHHKKHNEKTSLNTGYLLGVNVGYNICDPIRVEGEFAFRDNNRSKHENVDFGGKYNEYHSKVTAHIRTYSLMANAYYDFKICSCFTPYVGVGIGYAWNNGSFKARATEFPVHKTFEKFGNRFAWQVMAGVDYDLCKDIKVGVEYCFFNPHHKLDEHTVALTFKYAL